MGQQPVCVYISKRTLPARFKIWGYYWLLAKKREGHKSHLFPSFCFTCLGSTYLWVTSCLERSFRIRLLFFFLLTAPRPLPISFSRFCCFPLPAPGRTEGVRRALPTFQHTPAPNAWAQPHIVGILLLKGAAVLCLSTTYLSIKCRPFEAVAFHNVLMTFMMELHYLKMGN